MCGSHGHQLRVVGADVGGCGAGSAEEARLRTDLATLHALCTLAYWHHALFSSGRAHGNNPKVKPFWKDLYNAGAEIVMNGHDHDYERFAPQDPEAGPDPAKGIREFVVGTGGRQRRPFDSPKSNSEAHNADTHGVLKLALHPDHYQWQFIPVAGATLPDSGSGIGH